MHNILQAHLGQHIRPFRLGKDSSDNKHHPCTTHPCNPQSLLQNHEGTAQTHQIYHLVHNHLQISTETQDGAPLSTHKPWALHPQQHPGFTFSTIDSASLHSSVASL